MCTAGWLDPVWLHKKDTSKDTRRTLLLLVVMAVVVVMVVKLLLLFLFLISLLLLILSRITDGSCKRTYAEVEDIDGNRCYDVASDTLVTHVQGTGTSSERTMSVFSWFGKDSFLGYHHSLADGFCPLQRTVAKRMPRFNSKRRPRVSELEINSNALEQCKVSSVVQRLRRNVNVVARHSLGVIKN